MDRILRALLVVILIRFNLMTAYSNARLQSFEQDLHLQGEQYATLLSIPYVGFIIMEVPS